MDWERSVNFRVLFTDPLLRVGGTPHSTDNSFLLPFQLGSGKTREIPKHLMTQEKPYKQSF